MKFHFYCCLTTCLLCAYDSQAQQGTVLWKFSFAQQGPTVLLEMEGRLKQGYHIYSQHLKEGGPIPTRITFLYDESFSLDGGTAEFGEPVLYYDELFDMEITYYSDFVRFTQKIRPNDYPVKVKGVIKFMICDEHACAPGSKEFELVIEKQ